MERRGEKRKRRRSGREAEFEGGNKTCHKSAIFGSGWAARVPLHRLPGPREVDGPITGAAFRVPGSEGLYRSLFFFFFLLVGNSLRHGLGNSAAIDNAIIFLIVISTYLE
jgi:hypothetical protein